MNTYTKKDGQTVSVEVTQDIDVLDLKQRIENIDSRTAGFAFLVNQKNMELENLLAQINSLSLERITTQEQLEEIIVQVPEMDAVVNPPKEEPAPEPVEEPVKEPAPEPVEEPVQ